MAQAATTTPIVLIQATMIALVLIAAAMAALTFKPKLKKEIQRPANMRSFLRIKKMSLLAQRSARPIALD